MILKFIFIFIFTFLPLVSEEKFSYPGGELIGENGIWKDIKNSGEQEEYVESARDKFWVTIYGKENEKTITIPLKGGQAFIAETADKSKWKPLFITKNISKQNKILKKELDSEKKNKKELNPEISIVEEKFESTCITPEESELIRYLLKERAARKLPPLKVSESLTHVAKIHAKDLHDHPRPFSCLPQSWSDKGNWTACCYTRDHKNAQCMFDKPSELTDYKSEGYEMTFETKKEEKATPKEIFQKWKLSYGNHSVLTNKKGWKDKEWKVFGVGIYGKYGVIWLGTEEDPKPSPGVCKVQ